MKIIRMANNVGLSSFYFFKPLGFLTFGLIILLFAEIGCAHEQWFLTPDEMKALNEVPPPPIFSQLGITNITIFLFSMGCVLAWIMLWRKGGKELFADHQIRIASYGNLAAVLLRLTTAMMLLMAAFGLNPRSGVDFLTSPTLMFPDLELKLISVYWLWIKWLEVAIALGLIFGIYVRSMGMLIIAMSVLGTDLFGSAMLYYLGFLVGIGLYLVIQGPGAFFIKLPILPGFKKLYQWLSKQPVGRSQFMLRVSVGLDLAYTGFIYKFLTPNLAIGLLIMQDMPTFGMNMETVVFWMAIVETFSGILLVLGVLTRATSLILFGCFVFMSYAVNEPFLAHTIFYGALAACYINGAGQWKQGPAKDKPARIVILGASLAGIACAKKLEQLIGNISNVQVTIIHNETYFQYDPLLPDVIGGLVQPNNVVNPIRCLCQDGTIVQGEVKVIRAKYVKVILLSGRTYLIPYDQLIIAYGKVPDNSRLYGFDQFPLPIMTVHDAVIIRKHLLECLEKAAYEENDAERERLLTYVIINGGLRGASVAAEIRNLIDSAVICYPNINKQSIKIYLLDKHQEILSSAEPKVASLIRENLKRLNIIIKVNTDIATITHSQVELTSGEKIPCYIKISAISKYISLNLLFKENEINSSLAINEYLQLEGRKNIFVASIAGSLSKQVHSEALQQVQIGKLVGYNAWAMSQGYRLKRLKAKSNFISFTNLGQQGSTAQLGHFTFKGLPAWLFSRLVSMVIMPGFEKSLRVALDWALNAPFRKDIGSFYAGARSHAPETANASLAKGDLDLQFPYFQYSSRLAILRTEYGNTKLIFKLPSHLLVMEPKLVQKMIIVISENFFTSKDILLIEGEQFNKLINEIDSKQCQFLLVRTARSKVVIPAIRENTLSIKQ